MARGLHLLVSNACQGSDQTVNGCIDNGEASLKDKGVHSPVNTSQSGRRLK